MMFFLLMVFTSSSLAAPKPLIITIESLKEDRTGAIVQKLELTQISQTFRCKAEGFPEHRVKVEGLKSLDAPFKSQKNLSRCEKVITWGKAKDCYERHKIPMIDELIRWCTNI